MTLSAHKFLHHGRSRPPSLMTTAGRWGVWARSIKARHGLLAAARHRGVSMTLFAPSYALNLSSRRWQMNAWSLFPRINLTVAPLLSRLAPQGFIKRRAEVAQARAAVYANRRAEAIRSPGSQVGTLARGRDAAHAPATQPAWESAVIVAQRKVNGRRVEEQADAREVAPLRRVFRRAGPGAAQWHQQTAALSSGPLSVARRVTEEKRRVEQQARGATVMQQRTQPRRDDFERDDAKASGDRRRPGGFDLARDAAAAAARAAPPAFNIQQLTDEVVRQIDSRIVAHKERMGKLF